MAGALQLEERPVPSFPDVTFVIVTYNSAHCIQGCLDSIERHLPNANVVVVDNGSTDASVARVRSHALRVRLLELGENQGFGRACNKGVAAAEHEHVILLNPDVSIIQLDGERLAQAILVDRLGLVAPLLGDAARGSLSHRLYRNRHWISLGLSRLWAPLLPRELRRAHRSKTGRDAWASAAMLLLRRTEFLALGGFDERYFLYAEDMDVCRRYRAAGFPVRTTDAISGIHLGGGSSAREDAGPFATAWSIVGWVEYVHIWHGEESAERAASIALLSIRLQRAIIAAAAWPRKSERAMRKKRELSDIEGILRDVVGVEREVRVNDAAPCCREALDALHGAFVRQRRA